MSNSILLLILWQYKDTPHLFHIRLLLRKQKIKRFLSNEFHVTNDAESTNHFCNCFVLEWGNCDNNFHKIHSQINTMSISNGFNVFLTINVYNVRLVVIIIIKSLRICIFNWKLKQICRRFDSHFFPCSFNCFDTQRASVREIWLKSNR